MALTRAGRRLSLAIDAWRKLTKAERSLVEAEAERLAAFRGATLAGLS